jgi:hypothetical protein
MTCEHTNAWRARPGQGDRKPKWETILKWCPDCGSVFSHTHEDGGRWVAPAGETCLSCATLKKMVESGRVTDPVLAGQAALTTKRSLERDRALERAERAEAVVAVARNRVDSHDCAKKGCPVGEDEDCLLCSIREAIAELDKGGG